MLPSRPSLLLRPSFVTCTNVFGKIWTTHKNLSSSGTSSRGQAPRFHTPRSEQGIKIKLDEHIRATNMFQQVVKYNVHMTNILLGLSNIDIKNKQIIEEKDIFIQNLQGDLEKEQKLKA